MTTTTPPGMRAVEEAREVLAGPVTALAAGTLDVARRVDFIRHEVARGEAMREAIAEFDRLVQDVEGLAGDLDSTVAGMDGHLLPTRDAVSDLVDLSLRTTAFAATDIEGLAPALAIDVEMGALVQGWDDRGSRSESAERFVALLEEVDAMVAEARRLRLQPSSCGVLRTNRIRWAELVRERTLQLRDLAVAADGVAYDELRSRFDAAPFGEDRAAADAESRACWSRRTPLLAVPATIDTHLAAIESSLAGGP